MNCYKSPFTEEIEIPVQVTAVIYTSPVGIASLIAANLCKIQDLAGTIRALGIYIGTYMAGLAMLCFVMYPAVYWCCTRRSPLAIYRYVIKCCSWEFNAVLVLHKASPLAINRYIIKSCSCCLLLQCSAL